MVEKFYNRGIEKIEVLMPKKTKSRENILNRISKAKSYRKWMETRIALFRKDYKNCMNQKLFTPNEFITLLVDFKKGYDFYAEKEKFLQKNWKGKSGLTFIEYVDYIEVRRHQKKDIGEKPSLVVSKIDRQELNEMINSINILWNRLLKKGDEQKIKKGIPTREIAELTFGENWDTYVYSHRSLHHLITYCLNYLESKGKIKYSRTGHTIVLENPIKKEFEDN